MSESGKSSRQVCERAVLLDGGLAQRFEIERGGRRIPCFVIAYEGQVHAYRNSCPHRGTELDWQPGEVFDETGLYLVCATHGAVFEPAGGVCVGGPCHGASLSRIPISVENHLVVLQTDVLVAPQPPASAESRGE
ncbi:MAG TPA: Rieske 2Fe-2S domain-containing protein [Usitatibacteraceae bacterium]